MMIDFILTGGGIEPRLSHNRPANTLYFHKKYARIFFQTRGKNLPRRRELLIPHRWVEINRQGLFLEDARIRRGKACKTFNSREASA